MAMIILFLRLIKGQHKDMLQLHAFLTWAVVEVSCQIQAPAALIPGS
jgi:hypothetical protein